MNQKVFKTPFTNIYPLYVQKEKKGRTKEEVDKIILWLTAYNQNALQQDSTLFIFGKNL